MKFKSLIAAAALGAVMVACQGNNQGGDNSADNAAKADSLISYFGEMRGAEYLREAEKDTTLATEASKQAYLSGVRAGLNAVKDGNEAYNRGLFLGMQMAMNMNQFSSDYGIKLSSKVFVESLAKTIGSDSVGNPQEMQREFYRLMGEFNQQKEQRDAELAAANLEAAASKAGMVKITDQLYGKTEKGDTASLIKMGDRIKLDITATVNGRVIDAPMPHEITVGQRLKESPVTDAVLTVAPGQKGDFLTSAHALYKQRCQQLRLEPSDVVNLQITATPLKSED